VKYNYNYRKTNSSSSLVGKLFIWFSFFLWVFN